MKQRLVLFVGTILVIAAGVFPNGNLVAAIPSFGESKRPLSQVEVLGLLGGGVPSHRVAILVKERGIDFEPADDYLNLVRLRGGDEELISTLRNAKPVSHFQRCARLRDAGMDLEIKGESSAANEKYREAELECRAAEAEGYHPSVVHYELGELLVAEKRWDGAIAEYRESMSLEGEEDPDSHVGIGEALEGKGDLDGAIAEYRRALQVFEPISVENGGEYLRGINNLNLSTYHRHLGLALLNKGDIAGAMGEGRELVRLEPADAYAHEFLGSALEQAGDLAAALEEYGPANQLDPDRSDAREGVERVERKVSMQDRIKEAREAIRRSPSDLKLHLSLMTLLFLSEDLDGEIAEERELIRLELRNEYIDRCLLGERLLEKGDIDGAIAEFREVLRQEPNWDRGHLGLCHALDYKDELDAAMAECREAVRLGPHSDENHAALGDMLFRKHDIDGAIAEYREAVRSSATESDALQYHVTLGNLLTSNSEWTSAAQEFREILRRVPSADAAHYGLGLALEHQGDRRSALAEYRKACQLDSKNSTYQSAFERLSKEVIK